VQEYTIEFSKMDIMVGISLKNPNVLLEYFGDLHNHLWKQVILFKTMIIDEACVQERYLENIGHNKGHPSGSQQKHHQDASK